MCIATPMRVLSVRSGYARCVDRHGVEADLDLTLVGRVEPQQWLLAFHGSAREVIDAARAQEIDLALAAVEAVMRGDPAAIDAAFPDLVGREPQLPEFLR